MAWEVEGGTGYPRKRRRREGLESMGSELATAGNGGEVVRVRSYWQVLALGWGVCGLMADEMKWGNWESPEIGRGAFTDALGMLDREREEYADKLVAEAVSRAVEGKGGEEAMRDVRRILALALHLAPRQRKALVLNFQLKRGVLPEQKVDGHDSGALALLLHTRAGVLREQGGAENLLLARAFTELSAELDPKNEDAVYEAEIERLDHGRFDWSRLTDFGKAGVVGGGGGEGKKDVSPGSGGGM